ncbi:Signal transduction histidine kinase [Dysgonomonas macrotermitis]|uniref:histidine kinase n=2 Tax=Dysgonomonas macrotermitis TaxID=1346286 RepID=A0A1M5GI72_9BACT|nr:Signal transduction histidine kinase [Dysgonomonas macrotermitis]
MTSARYYLIIYFTFIFSGIFGQPKCFFEHYGTEDGLPQHTVMGILQDKKGFMWFSTWNGLCKFDGYNFTTYKIQDGDSYHMLSNRIDHMYEDKYGYIWTLSYDSEAHRFDPKTNRFMGLRSLPDYQDLTFTATTITPTPSGKVWLLSDKMGCVSIIDSTFKVEFYNIENKKIQSNKIHKIYEDSNLQTWILTDNGLYLLPAEGSKIKSFFTNPKSAQGQQASPFYSAQQIDDEIWFGSTDGKIWRYNNNNGSFIYFDTGIGSFIKEIKKIDNERILMVSAKNGFGIYNKKTDSISVHNKFNTPNLKSDSIISTYIDKDKNVWIEMDILGVSKYNILTGQMKHFSMKIESAISNVFPPNFFIFEDKQDRLYVHLRGGGFGYYDPVNDQLIPFYNEPSSPSWRFSNMLHVGFSDRQGNLWLSTRSHGLEKIIFNNSVFKSTIIDSDIHSTINNDVRSIFEDSQQRLWVSTKGGKMYLYDTDLNLIGYITFNGKIGEGAPLEGTGYSIIEDNKKNIWIGTKGDGIYKLSPTSDPKSYNVEHYKHNPSDPHSLSDNSIYSIHQDSKNRIWIGTYGGGLNLAEENQPGKFYNKNNSLTGYPIQQGAKIRIISSDKYGNICIGTTLGLIMFSPEFKAHQDIAYKLFTLVPGTNTSITNNDIYDICTTKDGETYLATFGGGVNKISEVDENNLPTQFISLTTENGLASDVVLTIVEDSQKNLWIASEGNLTRYNPKTQSCETYSEVSRLIKGQNFSEGSRITTRSGIIYFGYSKGLISIDPERLERNTFVPYVALTKLLISNKVVKVGDDSPLKENIDDLDHLRLSHKQNFISIEFAALDYIDPKRISYSYKLDGLDEDWIITKDQRIANYSNLSPGKYIFHVKSTNSDGIWMDNEHTLLIEIVPSFWQTGWAYLLYLIIFIAILYSILRTIFTFYRLRDRVILEHEQTEMKTRFFTDISHEIRTPLTMIVSPVENILEDEKTPQETRSQLQLVLKNANRMLRMVNQILDFRKIQKHQLSIQATPIGSYISDICQSFTKTAEGQNIDLKVNDQSEGEKIWIDRDSVEKLTFNLLSNSFKYTPSGRTIEVNIFKKDKYIALQVTDQGKGMTKDVLNKLFTRFASFNPDKSKPSTGIGLSIVKEVADRHYAKIQVESTPNEGSSFTVLFPLGVEHFDDSVNIVHLTETVQPIPTEKKDNITGDQTETPETEETSIDKEEQKAVILVVEDDDDLRHFISTILLPYYDVLEASNGKEGYELAVTNIPDFILSDLMMPEMDGVQFLQEIRNNCETSHIPFILLTAKTDMESRLSGLDFGADDYITKPFSVKYLRARINNIVQQRKRLFDTYTLQSGSTIVAPELTPSDEQAIDQEEQQITGHDNLFLQKVEEIIESNIDNSDFLIEDLVSAMAMSRTVFFKKLKSLTGYSPIEFVRNIKIKHAAKLITNNNEYTIKEISFMIGISDTKYFTQCFKKIFGTTPSEYRNQHREPESKK